MEIYSPIILDAPFKTVYNTAGLILDRKYGKKNSERL
jgi:hypothetical protein